MFSMVKFQEQQQACGRTQASSRVKVLAGVGLISRAACEIHLTPMALGWKHPFLVMWGGSHMDAGFSLE